MKHVLFVHQSAELYGSDKALLLFLSGLDSNEYFPVVVLPGEGPLKEELQKQGIKVVVSPVAKLYRNMFSVKNLVKFIKEIRESGLDLSAKYNNPPRMKIIISLVLYIPVIVSVVIRNIIPVAETATLANDSSLYIFLYHFPNSNK